ncbi:hypothetical protein [Paenibacillus sp. 481]|uniref:hypothetical protein n=1 Tax=Paenibacillus sp. 481 TaxID=2835869 RepID=UPI001E3FFA7F|nr:hypothetical protein [Paenibacillus sp. 481]UHA71899.1 hypothetical protein KIK04_14265 [Paenibacillus sp. 481]
MDSSYGYWRPDGTFILLITIPELKKLKGKKIRTTLPNIAGTVTAKVGAYNDSTNRVQLLNIKSDRTGTNYGDLSYLPEEISGLQVLDGAEGGTSPGTQDCTVTGGKGAHIHSGTATVYDGVTVDYTVHECEIEAKPKILGIPTGGNFKLTRSKNRLDATWPEAGGLTRYVFSIWVQNKALWAEVEHQHRVYNFPSGWKWKRTGGGKTKIGSWAKLKI